ncbi:MAG: S49 family peptidase [Bacteroidetes bacterium]|nr:S49 family peptidase [Bacteroidota bacterium]
MKRFLQMLIVFCCVTYLCVAQQPFSPFFERTTFSLSAPGAYRFGLYGTDNPALLPYVHEPDLFFSWWGKTGSWTSFKRWGLYGAIPHAGFSVSHENIFHGSTTDYKLSFGMGDRTFSTGVAFGWTSAENAMQDRSNHITLGGLYRPTSFLSLGAQYTRAFQTAGWEIGGDVVVRPFSTPYITFFTELYRYETPLRIENYWSTGSVFEVLDGIRISARYFSNNAISIGFHLSFGRCGIETQKVFSYAGRSAYHTYGIRVGAHDRSFIQRAVEPTKFVELDLYGPIGYQRYRLFDRRKTLMSLLNAIDAAKNDPMVTGIAVNTSGMVIDRAKLWELRNALNDFKSAGKSVIVFIDRGNIDLYSFASIADSIVMDPYGMLELTGYVRDRAYFKGTLEKIGLGFREIRLFKYKSAAESYSRESMSKGEREQWERILESWYSDVEREICKHRSLTPSQLRNIIDNEAIVLPERARELGLIDVIGRWDSVKAIVQQYTGNDNSLIPNNELWLFHEPFDAQWGEPPTIAIIYALGPCAMDEGIKARELSKHLEEAYNDSNIKAIVLRIDSPGGDPIASDYVARLIKHKKGKKPLIVSQGYVAASGGYWLSMYADTIVATPSTLTGSIGVIGGWLYNKGLKESLGVSTDKVTIGAHADLYSGIRIPLLDLQIPDRDVRPEEFEKLSSTIMTIYSRFTANVAEGRTLTPAYVDSVGQGRLWTGSDALTVKLVDVLGGLNTALRIAKERAGIPAHARIKVVEKPQLGLFNFELLVPKFVGIEMKTFSDYQSDLLPFYLKYNGDPLTILPLQDYYSLQQLNWRITR